MMIRVGQAYSRVNFAVTVNLQFQYFRNAAAQFYYTPRIRRERNDFAVFLLFVDIFLRQNKRKCERR